MVGFKSIVSADRINEWQSSYFFPKVVRTRVPSNKCHIYEPEVGWLVIFKAQLECVLRFPPHPFLRGLVASHGLAINQQEGN